MKMKKMLCLLLAAVMTASVATGCGDSKKDASADANTSTDGGSAASNNGEIREYTAFFAVPGAEINDDNEIQQQ